MQLVRAVPVLAERQGEAFGGADGAARAHEAEHAQLVRGRDRGARGALLTCCCSCGVQEQISAGMFARSAEQMAGWLCDDVLGLCRAKGLSVEKAAVIAQLQPPEQEL